jgi:hypothetical protein
MVSKQPNFVWCQGSASSLLPDPEPTTLTDCVAHSPIDCPQEGVDIARSIICGNAIAICDGSYKDHFGTAGFVIQTWDQQLSRIIGASITPGHMDDQNPYRSEIGGIFGIVVVVDALVKKYDMQNGTIEIECNCKSALIAIFEYVYDMPTQPHHDLIHAI